MAEDDSLTKKTTHLYTLKEMVLLEDELKIYNEPLATRLDDTNQQLKKWINRWRQVIDHSMKRVRELAKENSNPIWRHYTKNKQFCARKIEKGICPRCVFLHVILHVFFTQRAKFDGVHRIRSLVLTG